MDKRASEAVKAAISRAITCKKPIAMYDKQRKQAYIATPDGEKKYVWKKAKAEGYFIKCFFILTVDASVNVARVSARVASGGHSVDEKAIRARYSKSLSNIKELMKICDIMHVYDNTIEHIRIIRKHKDEISIYPNDLWSEEMILNLLWSKKELHIFSSSSQWKFNIPISKIGIPVNIDIAPKRWYK